MHAKTRRHHVTRDDVSLSNHSIRYYNSNLKSFGHIPIRPPDQKLTGYNIQVKVLEFAIHLLLYLPNYETPGFCCISTTITDPFPAWSDVLLGRKRYVT